MTDGATSPARDPRRFEPIPAQATERCVGSRFDRVARCWPERAAIDTGERVVSYRALAARAEAVCAAVRHACGEAPARVGLYFERPEALVAAILGVLKAGCAYVPLDPYFPATRLTTILKDAEATLILCDGATASLAREIAGGERAVVDVETCDGTPPPEEPSDPDRIASILYTSGSTGEPKGVLQSHRNLIQYARNYVDVLRMRPADRVSLLFSYAFSASVPDVFGTLLCGATLCPFDLRRRGVAELAAWVRDAGISLLHLAPSVFRHFANHAEVAGPFPALRAVDLGGEAAFAADLAAFRRFAGPDCALFHRLAATEISLITAARFAANDEPGTGVLPAGHALEGVEVRIEAPDGTRLPRGATGEIVLRSRTLSPGYWRRPELTRATFRDDPDGGGVRLYRTGDRGRLLPDGSLEHRGRRAQRVKVRGHTVELAEVEAALRALAPVLECAVAALDRPGGDAILVAFVLLRSGGDARAAWFRRELARTLPTWMVPARFEFPGEFPVTSTGKVDRARLLALHRENAELTPAVAPRSSVERQLVSIWQEALGNTSLGIRDDYFELGGSSLEAVHIVSLIDERLGRELTPSVLVEHPTIEKLAEWIERDETPDSFRRIVELKGGGGAPPVFCFPGNGGEPIVFQAFAQHLDGDRPCYGLRPPGRFGRGRPPRRVEDIAASLVPAIREVQPHGPYYFAGFSFGSTVAVEVARILQDQGEAVPVIAMVDGWAPGHPRLRPDRPLLHRLVDRVMGRGLLERQRISTARILYQGVKMRLRDIECAVPERLGRPLSPKLRRRRQKRWAIRARARYRPRPHAGRILLVRATEETYPDVFDYAPLRGWDALALDGVSVLELPGSHLEMLAEPNARDVARWITDEIEAERPTSRRSAPVDGARSGPPTGAAARRSRRAPTPAGW